MSLPATDNFNGTEGTALPTWNAGWTHEIGTWEIIGTPSSQGAAHPLTVNGNSLASARWSGDAFSGDHYSQVVDFSAQNYPGPMTRVQAGTGEGYLYFHHGYLYRIDAGALAGPLSSSFPIPANADTFRLESNGTSHSGNVNGGTQVSVTDATYSGGSAGIGGYSTSARLDTWEGGNLGAGPAPPGLKTTLMNKGHRPWPFAPGRAR